MIGDYTENICIAVMLSSKSAPSDAAARLASTGTSIKWLFTGISAVIVVGGLIGLGIGILG